MDFPRQRKSVTVTVEGDDPRDVAHYAEMLRFAMRNQPDEVQILHPSSFIIHPRAVND